MFQKSHIENFEFLNGNCVKIIMKFSYLISLIIAEKVYHGLWVLEIVKYVWVVIISFPA